MKMTVQKSISEIPIPADSLIFNGFGTIDYADAYQTDLPPSWQKIPVDAVAVRLLADPPRWVRKLVAIRNIIVRPFGLKREFNPPRSSQLPFRVIQQVPNEIVIGEQDSHLDFRLSVQLRDGDAGRCVVISTVVHFNNMIGRTYFIPVRCFHKVIVRNMLGRLKP